jgi:glycosyltransferase involved in cell wall biosynthesis
VNKEGKIFITVVVGSLRRGGAEMQLFEILPRLNNEKYHIDVLLLSTRGSLADSLEEKGISIINPWYDTKGKVLSMPVRMFRLVIILSQLFSYFIVKRPDIAHFFLPQSYCLAMPVAIITGIKVKLMSRLSLNNYQHDRRWMWKLEKILHKFTTHIIVNSEGIKQQVIDAEGVDKKKISRIYSGIKINDSFLSNKLELRKKYELNKNGLILIMVANLIPYKGHIDLIKSLGIISSDMPDEWQILFIGRDDGIKQDLIGETEKQGIAEHCLFLQPEGDVSEYYYASDIGILSSHEEGFSIAILEGMRSKLPMVVTDVGGNAEAVIDNKTGFVIPARDCDAIAKALLELSLSPEMRNIMGAAGYSRVVDNFSIENCVEKHDELYSSLV